MKRSKSERVVLVLLGLVVFLFMGLTACDDDDTPLEPEPPIEDPDAPDPILSYIG